MKKPTSQRRGFTLIEVLVASMMIALMMMPLLTFVQYAGDAWQRSHQEITLVNEGNTLLDAYERELNRSVLITAPALNAAAVPALRFVRPTSDYMAAPKFANLEYEFGLTGSGAYTIIDLGAANPYWVAALAEVPAWASATSGAAKRVVMPRHNYVMARHVRRLEFTRPGANLVHVSITLGSTREQDGLDREIGFERDILVP